MKFMSRFIPWLVILSLFLPSAALAQSEPANPGLPEGGNLLFLPMAQRPAPRQFAVPFPVIITGGGQAEAAEANGTVICGDPLQALSASADIPNAICLPGDRIGFSGLNYAVTSAGWDGDRPIGFGATTAGHQVNGLTLKDASLLLSGNVGLSGSKFEFTNSDVVVFKMNLNKPTDLQGASVQGIAYNPLELMARILRLTEGLSRWHPIPMPPYIKIYREIGFDGLSINEAGCSKYLDWEGALSWPWYVSPLESRTAANGDLRVAGWWGAPSNPLQAEGVATCMKDRRYMLFDDLLFREGFAFWRDELMADTRLVTADVQSFVVPQLGDDIYGGQWYVTIAAIGAGIVVYGEYIANGFVTATTGMFIILPAWAVQCLMTPGATIETCRVQNVAVSQATVSR